LFRYVERRALNQRFVAHASVDTPEDSMVLVGPRGGGKTTAIKRFLTRRSKVVYLQLSPEFPTITAALKHKLGIVQASEMTSEEILGPLSELRGDEKPVLVVEVDSEAEKDAVAAQSQMLKVLAVDLQLIHAIIVLSDANAAFKLKQDENRQTFVWVGDFTAGEMDTFLDKRGVLPTDEEAVDGPNSKLRRRILDEIGANPQMLKKMARAATAAVAALQNADEALSSPEARRAAEHGAIEAFIEKRNELAKAEVNNLLTQSTDKDTPRRLMRLLLGGDFPGGVSQYDGDFSAKKLGEEVKEKFHRALCFNSETNLCQFFSPMHERAARDWFEEENEKERKRL
jgi:hypothetical protein